MTKISKVRIDAGTYYWTITNEVGQETDCRTNHNGEGIWHRERFGWKQNTGNCQFSMAGKSLSAARSFLRREYKD